MNYNKTTASLIVLLVAVSIGGGTMFVTNSQQQVAYATLFSDYQDLMTDFSALADDFSDLESDYSILSESYNLLGLEYLDLIDDYNTLSDSYDALQSAYDSLYDSYQSLLLDYAILESAYNALIAWIGEQILPIQLSIWAESVRQYYLYDYYLSQSSTTKEYYMEFTRFCRDIVTQSTGQANPFLDVTLAYADALRYGTNIEALTDMAMYDMAMYAGSSYQDFPYRWGWGFSGGSPDIWGGNAINNDVITNIAYEYDSDITYHQSNPTWDYPKFPVETAFRTMGDCEDQAILLAAYFEASSWVVGATWTRWEAVIAMQHDPAHPTLGAFYHGTMLVHIHDTAAFASSYPSTSLWTIPNDPYSGYTWHWLDPTWNVPFGGTPSWLQAYITHGGLSTSVVSMAYCEAGGAVV